jgi:hypothetical protein
MRLAYTLFFVILLGIIGSTWLTTNVYSPPQVTATEFLAAVKQGNYVKAVRHFGSNACRCPAKGGWVSYLIYKSGQEHNMAFMMGHPFDYGTPVSTQMKNTKQGLLPWQKPEDYAVDVPITFDAKQYMPYFLPLKMAYGQEMTEAEFNDFLKDPDKDAWKGFTLRFRPGLAPGTVAPPVVEVPRDLTTQFIAITGDPRKSKSDRQETDSAGTAKTGKTDKNDAADMKHGAASEDAAAEEKSENVTEDDVKQALGKEASNYLTPRDAGKVLLADGKSMPLEQIAAKLPRLKSALLRLHIVRRGELNDWTVYHFGLMYPHLLLNDGHDLLVEHDHRPN